MTSLSEAVMERRGGGAVGGTVVHDQHWQMGLSAGHHLGDMGRFVVTRDEGQYLCHVVMLISIASHVSPQPPVSSLQPQAPPLIH